MKHADAIQPLNRWYNLCKSSDWKNLPQMKRSINSLDAVGNDRFVFNIKGNDYRLVAMVFFDIRTMYIRFIGTHTEYDETDCSTI
jgi:mRNA interferase HigB